MELRSKVEAALKEHGPMSVKQLRAHVKCSWLAKLCSNLSRHGVIRKLGGGTRSGVYGLAGQTLKGQDKADPQRKAPKRAQRKAATPAASRPKPAQSKRGDADAAFAINEEGELGITKEGTKVSLDAVEFERLRGFIERTEPVWKAA